MEGMKMKVGKTGVTTSTPKQTLFGAGTVHKNLKYDSSTKKWNFEESLIGATSGGTKFTINPEITSIDEDGAYVKVKGLNAKTGETCTLETNFSIITPELVKTAILGKDGESNINEYVLIESKADIDEGDYLENIAFVGKLLNSDKNVIFIMDNALCTSGLEADNKNKEGTVSKYTFECYADSDSDLDKLPYHFYYPKDVANQKLETSEKKVV